MKKLLLSSVAILAFGLVNAQIFSANSGADFSGWQYYDADGDGANWFTGDVTTQPAPFDLQGECLLSDSWDEPNQVALTPDNSAISPVIDCSAEPTVMLSWKEASFANALYSAEKYAVYVVTDPLAILAGTYPTPVYETTLSGEAPFTTQTLDISSIAGNSATVYIVFRHYDCTDQLSLMIDDIVVASSFVGLDEEAVEAAAYPNPASTLLNINTSSDAQAISIYNMDGKVVATAEMSGLHGSINVADLVDGVYFYEVAANNGTFVRNKFVKK